jgi:hypothetical protein
MVMEVVSLEEPNMLINGDRTAKAPKEISC